MTESVTLTSGRGIARIDLLGAQLRSFRLDGRETLWPGSPDI